MGLFGSNSKVIKLGKKNFDLKGKRVITKSIKDKKGILFFGAPWCGHCVNASKAYNEVADILGDSFPVLYVDTTENPTVMAPFGIRGFPTIVFIDKFGKIYKDYNGDRSVDSFLSEICIESSICSRR